MSHLEPTRLSLPKSHCYITDQSVIKTMPSSTVPPTPPTARQRRKDARPSELMDAALELFVEHGFAATRTDDIAQRAGVSKGTLYLYYASKEELLKAVIRERLSEQIAAGAEEVARFEGPTPELLRTILTAWWQRIFESPSSGVFKLVITEARAFPEIADFYAQEVTQPGSALIGRILQRGIDRRELRAVDVNHAVHSLVLPMVMLCLHQHTIGACSMKPPHIDGPRFIADHIDLMLHGLVLPPPRPAEGGA